MSFPTVNGMLIETEDETSNKPTANARGFFSGLANATIFRNDDAFWLSLGVTANIRDHNEGFGVGGVGTGVLYALRDPRYPEGGVDCGTVSRCWNPRWRHDLPTDDVREAKDVRPQLANEFATGFSTRKPCMRSGSSSSSSSGCRRREWCVSPPMDFVRVGVNDQPEVRTFGEVAANTSPPRDTQHSSLPFFGGEFRQSQGSIPPFWLNNHGQILLVLVSGAIGGLCSLRGGPHEDRKQDNREGVSFVNMPTGFADAIGPIPRRNFVGLRALDADEHLTDCTTANAFVIRTIHRPGSAEQVVGFWRRCLRCMLFPHRLQPLHLLLRVVHLEHRKAYPVDP